MGIKYSVKYNGKMFDGIDKKVARTHLRNFMRELCSGTSGNPLYEHWQEGQSTWNDDDPEYARYKRNTFGSTKKFQYSGDALNAIKAKNHKYKKINVSWRKKKGYWFMSAGLRKMEDGKNIYQIAQLGRADSLIGKSGGEDLIVKVSDYNKDLFHAGLMYEGSEAQKQGVKKGKFQKQVVAKKYNFDKGGVKRTSQNERLITKNMPGDERYVKQEMMNKHIEAMIKASGYKVK